MLMLQCIWESTQNTAADGVRQQGGLFLHPRGEAEDIWELFLYIYI